jgi:hypothetical protein
MVHYKRTSHLKTVAQLKLKLAGNFLCLNSNRPGTQTRMSAGGQAGSSPWNPWHGHLYFSSIGGRVKPMKQLNVETNDAVTLAVTSIKTCPQIAALLHASPLKGMVWLGSCICCMKWDVCKPYDVQAGPISGETPARSGASDGDLSALPCTFGGEIPKRYGRAQFNLRFHRRQWN